LLHLHFFIQGLAFMEHQGLQSAGAGVGLGVGARVGMGVRGSVVGATVGNAVEVVVGGSTVMS